MSRAPRKPSPPQTRAEMKARSAPWAPRQRQPGEAPPRTVGYIGDYEPWRDTPPPALRQGAQEFLTKSSRGVST